MTDIVERLRASLTRHRDHAARTASAIREAAAELERLQTGWELATKAVDENQSLKAEIERLRAALESLTHDPPATLDEPDTDAEVVIKMREIARRALEPKP